MQHIDGVPAFINQIADTAFIQSPATLVEELHTEALTKTAFLGVYHGSQLSRREPAFGLQGGRGLYRDQIQDFHDQCAGR